MRNLQALPTFAAVTLLAAAFAGCVAQPATQNKIILAIQPTQDKAKLENASLLEAFLENRTGVDVEIFSPKDNAALIEALRGRHADAALMGSLPAQLAVAKGGAEVALAEMRDVAIGTNRTVAPYYYSYYVVLKDSPYTNFSELRGKTVAYTSTTSTSGFLFPVARLVDLGLIAAPSGGKAADPKEFFGDVIMAGSYDNAWKALQEGQADVAVIAGDVKESTYNTVLGGTRILETQGPVPSHALVFADDFKGTELAGKLESAFLELKGEKQALMRQLVSGIFVSFEDTTSAQHLGTLKTALDKVGLDYGGDVKI